MRSPAKGVVLEERARRFKSSPKRQLLLLLTKFLQKIIKIIAKLLYVNVGGKFHILVTNKNTRKIVISWDKSVVTTEYNCHK